MKMRLLLIIFLVSFTILSFGQRKCKSHVFVMEPAVSYILNKNNIYFIGSAFLTRYKNESSSNSFLNKFHYGLGLTFGNHANGLYPGIEYNYKLLEIKSNLFFLFDQKYIGLYANPLNGISTKSHDLFLLIGYNFLLNERSITNNLSGPIITLGSRIKFPKRPT